MKLAICSDIHLELGPISFENTENADVLILAGNICIAEDFKSQYINVQNKAEIIRTFFEECCQKFPNVIYIMGNYEHHNGDFAKTLNILREHLGDIQNLYILEKEFVQIDDVSFVAGTLWTDLNKCEKSLLNYARGYTHDYKFIKNSNEISQYKIPVYATKENGEKDFSQIVDYVIQNKIMTFAPIHSLKDHEEMLQFMKNTVESNSDKKIVAVTHHAPSKISRNKLWKEHWVENSVDNSDLSEFIVEHPQIKLWIHGHILHEFDYMVGETRIFCNPCGFTFDGVYPSGYKLKYVEI